MKSLELPSTYSLHSALLLTIHYTGNKVQFGMQPRCSRLSLSGALASPSRISGGIVSDAHGAPSARGSRISTPRPMPGCQGSGVGAVHVSTQTRFTPRSPRPGPRALTRRICCHRALIKSTGVWQERSGAAPVQSTYYTTNTHSILAVSLCYRVREEGEMA